MKISYYLIFLFVLLSGSIYGQAINKEPEIFVPAAVSESGTVVVYFNNTSKESNCVIHLMKTGEKLSLKNVTHRMLISDTHGLFHDYSRQLLYVVDFNSKKIDTIANIREFEGLTNMKHAVYHTKSNEVVLYNAKSHLSEKVEKVLHYTFDKEQNKLALLTKENKLLIKDLITGSSVGHDAGLLKGFRLKKVKWDSDGKEAYLFAIDDKYLHLFSLSNLSKKIGSYLLKDENTLTQIDTMFNTALVLSEKHLAISVRSIKTKEAFNANVEIWNTKSDGFPPLLKFYSSQNQLMIIDTKSGILTSLTQDGSAIGYRTDAAGSLYRYNKLQHDDISSVDPPISLHRYDFKDKQLNFYRKFSGQMSNLLKYKKFPHFVFYENNHWHYFDENEGNDFPISSLANDGFYSDKHEYYKVTGTASGNAPLEWQGKGFFLNGLNDIWFYDWKTNKIKQITNSAEEKKEYALSNSNHDLKNDEFGGPEMITKPYNDLIVTWTSGLYEFEGIDLLKADGSLITLTYDKAHYSQIKRNEDFLIYVKEKVNQPPSIYLYDLKNGKETHISQSNQWDKKSKEIKSEHFYWYDKNKQVRGGIVRFPKNYNDKESKKYPVIVNIYEKKYKNQNRYVAPGFSSSNINFREYVEDDYFVIEPDIYYEIGKTGESALNCINETVDFLAKVFPLDTLNMGIHGHSFGGYQTNFVVTQTPRFKAAISSAGVADVVSFYLTYSQDIMQPDAFRMETQQWRFGKSFFDDTDLYIKNSPVYHAKNVTTPLLLISGKNDTVINWEQSVFMFTALKRLGKEAHLLLYDKEGHAIQNEDNQKDVSKRTKEWFDYHLKGQKAAGWISNKN